MRTNADYEKSPSSTCINHTTPNVYLCTDFIHLGIIEGFSYVYGDGSTSLARFANFGTVIFTGAYAKTSSGTIGVSGTDILDIKQSRTVLTDCSVSESSTAKCSYVCKCKRRSGLKRVRGMGIIRSDRSMSTLHPMFIILYSDCWDHRT